MCAKQTPQDGEYSIAAIGVFPISLDGSRYDGSGLLREQPASHTAPTVGAGEQRLLATPVAAVADGKIRHRPPERFQITLNDAGRRQWQFDGSDCRDGRQTRDQVRRDVKWVVLGLL